MPTVMAKLLTAAALAAVPSKFAEAARFKRDSAKQALNSKSIAGVPVINYDLRYVQDESKQAAGTSAELEWTIMFNHGVSQADIETFCGGAAKGACRTTGHADKGLPFATAIVSEQRLEKMLAGHSGAVEFVEPDLPVFVIPDVPEIASESDGLWGHPAISLEQTTFTGKGVHVYVMDTGVRVSHNDFGGRAIPTLDTIMGDGTPYECNGDPACAADTHSHGTHCAGTAAGTKYGAAKEATIHAMRVCCGPGSNTLVGMDWITQKSIRPALVTMSLGSWGNSMAGKMAVDTLTEAGIAVFVSAGNNDADACRKTYAFVDSAITIGSTMQDDAGYNVSGYKRSGFSNWGSCVNLWAPGSRILSAGIEDDDSSSIKSGTSMATPLAAGVGALYIEEFPDITPEQIKEALVNRGTQGILSDLTDDDLNAHLSAV